MRNAKKFFPKNILASVMNLDQEKLFTGVSKLTG
jgi:hypothetical protein